MSTFALKEFNDVIGKIKFFKLIENKICYWDEFCKEIEKDTSWEEQLVSIKSRMNDVANLKMLPDSKFKKITPNKEQVDEYEIKTRDLRVYLIKNEDGNIVILGGKKNSQVSDIRTFRSIKKEYLKLKNDTRKTT
ncbi:hypothetical protein [uncultured Mucilaginibacter sp.]|uniref:hypothetical protein n=1 Tax=uncultured Mucilaginibacter sp. TaxID=797541 RepID=UPI0025F024CB|nr:hypothetical protein [uncultured Mucilaginibacter sp.]